MSFLVRDGIFCRIKSVFEESSGTISLTHSVIRFKKNSSISNLSYSINSSTSSSKVSSMLSGIFNSAFFFIAAIRAPLMIGLVSKKLRNHPPPFACLFCSKETGNSTNGPLTKKSEFACPCKNGKPTNPVCCPVSSSICLRLFERCRNLLLIASASSPTTESKKKLKEDVLFFNTFSEILLQIDSLNSSRVAKSKLCL